MLVGQRMVGAFVSRTTVIVKVHRSRPPQLSCTWHVTVLVPRSKTLPEGGTQEIAVVLNPQSLFTTGAEY
jgi:hypothetical protein